jgi:predicted nuclease of predicted toxin-antitoxin system
MKDPTVPKIKLLADECVSRETIDFICSLGITIFPTRDFNLDGAVNGTVLKRAIDESLVFITEDQDFCDILTFPPASHHGFIVLKVTPQIDKEVFAVLKSLLSELKPADFEKTLVIVDNKRYRIRRDIVG